ncbi:hypothetical protein [Streptomyces acidiscabies]|uniref:Uncharacterized protein n=1 Tax=Streptomyces acidiscabies TaxID=42234 RepID=A0AAP6BE94_9ACTN|nr:hypothetical protein [Streptomyces acidiscabies]MBP5939612.1 hypothetical protein [Streptomyces sp. LBUM 1476]MBZ3910777.1 hypothetical protein [Streptomyces acidiscabies]MDX2963040.1 hypothetical protein [Streptomyces acidiscabies]MDX3017414.1 hypothetical protein [Streptomyces acidiscabies]MDX3787890.1 hypothetical protein [Streptomyces acidiscabies]
MSHVRCPNPTCKGPQQRFRDLEGAEIAAAAQVMSKFESEQGERFRPSAYHRCTGTGCRRIQRKDKWTMGGNLPEEMQIRPES